MRTVFECTECQYRYNAPWYEPTWLARTQFEPEHPQVHKLWETWTSKPETNPLAQHWMRTERERIIQLLQVMRNDLASCIKDDDCLVRADVIDVCISDIKGENE